MALVVEVKEGGVWGAAVKGAILQCMCIHRSGTNENQEVYLLLGEGIHSAGICEEGDVSEITYDTVMIKSDLVPNFLPQKINRSGHENTQTLILLPAAYLFFSVGR